jgi:serralysin
VTGDGPADIVTGAGPGGAPHVKAFDGQSLATTHSFFAYDVGFIGGVAVAIGDVTGDDLADIVTGTWAGAPHVKVFAGGVEARSFFALDPELVGGVRVAVGDMNGDGFAEIVAGQAAGGDRVRTFDGNTGDQRFDFAAFGGFTGGVTVGATDRDSDGLSDIAVAAGVGGAPHVRLLSGLNLAELAGFYALDAAFLGGVHVG